MNGLYHFEHLVVIDLFRLDKNGLTKAIWNDEFDKNDTIKWLKYTLKLSVKGLISIKMINLLFCIEMDDKLYWTSLVPSGIIFLLSHIDHLGCPKHTFGFTFVWLPLNFPQFLFYVLIAVTISAEKCFFFEIIVWYHICNTFIECSYYTYDTMLN